MVSLLKKYTWKPVVIFYQVPMEMYSPASVVIVNTKTGKIHKAGKINTEILARSFNDTVSG